MIPKINFKYSWIYDEKMEQLYEAIKKERNLNHKYPDWKETLKYTKQIYKKWSAIANKVLIAIEKTSGLKWKEPKITCYVVGRTIAFSDPLTVGTVNDKNWFIDILTHELIHQIFVQNMDKKEKYWKYLEKKYPKYGLSTRIHITLLAIHKSIYLTLSNKSGLKRDIKRADKVVKYSPQYKTAWDVVDKEGYKNLIKEFKKF